jgi:signal transduction histidine kinase/ActR/RegA family two-component response regulator
MSENIQLPEYSFQRKEMKQAISFLEEINMVANVGGWEMDLQNNQLYWTAGTKRIQELPPDYEPDFDKALIYYKEGESRERLQELVRRAIKHGESFDEEFQMVTARGREIWVRSIARPHMDDSRCVRLYGSVQDITERKTLELKNDELRSLYEHVVNLSGMIIQAGTGDIDKAINATLATLGNLNKVDRICIYELDHKLDELNLTHEWCNKGREPVLGQNVVLPFSELPELKEQFLSNNYVHFPDLDNIPDKYSRDKEMLKLRGAQSLFAAPMFSGTNYIGFIVFDSIVTRKTWDEKIISLLRILADICAGAIGRRRIEESLIEARQIAEYANMAKNEFISNIGSELKTPLHAMLGFAQVLLKSNIDEASRSHVQVIEKNGNILSKMIDDLLVLSKIEAQSQESRLQPTIVQNLVEEIRQIYTSEIENRQLSFRLDFPEKVKVFLLDQLRLRQVLNNLISNAVKYTNRGFIKVKMHYFKTPGASNTYELRITVQDSGIGIIEANRKLIFDFFKRSGSGLRKAGGGLGLGLHIAKRLTEIMDGHIEMESEFGKGSSFSIVLSGVKLQSDDDENGIINQDDVKAIFRGQQVLVVEDVKMHFDVVRELLAGQNLQLIHASNGEEGVEKAKQLKPDLILMDLRMEPGISGYEATALIRNNPETASIPVVVFSSNIEDRRMEENKHLFNDFLRKAPTDYKDLIAVLGKFLAYDEAEKEEKTKLIITDEDIPDDDEFLNGIIKLMGTKAASLAEIIDITDIEMFVADLESLQQQGNSARLDQYIKSLKSAYEAFDFDILTDLLKNFTNKLKN